MSRPLAACAILLTAVILGGCERIAPIRTLPNWVQGVYVPMVKNTSYWPGIEEDLTRQVQESFLTDGRVSVVPKNAADLIVQVEVTDWRRRTSGTTGDDVADRTEYTVTATVKLFQPMSDEPMATLPPIIARGAFNTDARSIDYVPEPDRAHEVLGSLAWTIVQTTMTGFPATMQ